MTTESSTSPLKPMLDRRWVAKIFQAMQGHYGTRFLNLWRTDQLLPSGEDAGLENAMNYWAEKLAGFADNPHAIKHVLEKCLPEEPPSLPQFIDLCRKAPPPKFHRIEHKLTEQEMERNRERIKELLAQYGPKKMPPGEPSAEELERRRQIAAMAAQCRTDPEASEQGQAGA